jgi:hypothetical protein
MTSIPTTARRALALALAGLVSTLSACGGFTSVDVGGTIVGLTGTGLVLANGGSSVAPAPGATSFVFPNQVAIRDTYSVSVTTQPTQQTCVVFNPSGTAGAAPVTIVSVICSTNTYALGGTVTGLTGTNLVLTNGSDQVTIPAGDAGGNASFTFPVPVADGTAYGVAVLTQPSGQTCTVANGSAFMGGAPVTNVSVTCH